MTEVWLEDCPFDHGANDLIEAESRKSLNGVFRETLSPKFSLEAH